MEAGGGHDRRKLPGPGSVARQVAVRGGRGSSSGCWSSRTTSCWRPYGWGSCWSAPSPWSRSWSPGRTRGRSSTGPIAVPPRIVRLNGKAGVECDHGQPAVGQASSGRAPACRQIDPGWPEDGAIAAILDDAPGTGTTSARAECNRCSYGVRWLHPKPYNGARLSKPERGNGYARPAGPCEGAQPTPSAASNRICWSGRGRSVFHTRPAVATSGCRSRVTSAMS